MTPWEWTHAAIGALASAIFLLQTLGMGEDGGDADSPDTDFDYGEIHDHVSEFSGYLSHRQLIPRIEQIFPNIFRSFPAISPNHGFC